MSYQERGDPPSVVAHAWGPWGFTEAPLVQNYFQNYTKASLVLFASLCVKRVLGDPAGGILVDVHNHRTFTVKRMQVSPQNVPDEVLQTHFLRTQSGVCIFLTFLWQNGSPQNASAARDGCVRGNTRVRAGNWSSGCSVDRRVDVREWWTQPVINVHLGLGYLADSVLHTNKWACDFKADNWQGQLIRKTQTFKQKN